MSTFDFDHELVFGATFDSSIITNSEVPDKDTAFIDVVQAEFSKIDNILNDLHWYDKKVFEIVAKGVSVAELSRNTKISYYSLYNTYTITKKHIKNKL